MTFASLNAGPAISAFWWLEIEGLRKRYGTYLPSWNPADSGMNQHIEQLVVEPPRIGAQSVDPLNGSAEISSHSVMVLDTDDQITDLLSSASVGDKAFLTKALGTGTVTELVVDDTSDLPASGHLYIDRETFYYTTKDAAKTDTGVATVSSGTKTAAAGDTTYLTCAALTEDNGHWEGAICVFIATAGGVNDGQRREVFRSTGSNPLDGTESEWAPDVGTTENANCLYFDPNDPLPAAVVATDTFALTQPPRRARCSALAGATDDYWEGAVLTVTADPVNAINVGESRIVTAFNATTKVLTFNEPLPEPLDFASPGDGAATISIAKYSLSGISRGLYKSRQEAHKILDSRGDYSPVEVTTRPMFMRTRRAWIYEGRVGCIEAEAKRRQGVLADITLTPDMTSYEFSIDSLQRLLSQKILQNPWRGVVQRKIWGGALGEADITGSDVVLSKNAYPTMADGDANCDTWVVRAKALEAPRVRGNVKIGNELIHYSDSAFFQPVLSGSGYYQLRLSDIDDADDLAQVFATGIFDAIGDQGYLSHELKNWGVKNRGLLSKQCGKVAVAKWSDKAQEKNPRLTGYYYALVPAFIEEHNPGDDITEVMLCDDSSKSDFAQIDMIVCLPGSYTGTLAVGDTITGDATGASGIVVRIFEDGSNARIWVRRTDTDEDTDPLNFIAAESLSGPVGWGAEIESLWFGDGSDGPARNNPINVILTMLLSGGTADKSYAYLPEGWGLGLAEDDVDIDGIELLRDRFFSNVRVNFAITEPVDFAEWSEKLFRSLSLFPFETTDGKLSLGYMLTESECVDIDDGSLLALGSSILDAKSAPNWTAGRNPITKVEVKYNKHPCSSDWFGKLEINFARSRGTAWDYGRSETIECPMLYVPDNSFERVDPRDPELPDLIARLINPLWGRHTMFPAPVVNVTVRYSYDAQIEIGDVVKLTHALLPNLRTGSRGFDGEYFQVVSKSPDATSGTCDLELWQIGIHDAKYGRVAPSAEVISYAADTPSAGKSRITVHRQIYGEQGYDPDAAYFVVGDEICLLDANGDPLASPAEVATVEVVVSTAGATQYLQLGQNLTTAPSAGDVVSLPEYDSATSARRSKNAFLCDSDGVLGSGGNAAFRYH